MKFTKAIVAVTSAALLTGCNISDSNAKWFPWTTPDEGTVNGRSYTPERWQWQAGTTSCSGTPTVCTTTPGHMQYIPEYWSLDLHAPDGDHGWVVVDEWEFDRCEEKDYYPDCNAG